MPMSDSWDTRYEKKAVLLLCIGFGLVGFDRFMIMPLFPIIKKAMNLSYGDLGLITGVLSIAWGLASIFAGRLSDRVGRRPVLVTALILFSLLAGFSGLAGGLAVLLVIRAVMGFAEGAFTPTSIVATIEAAEPHRQGALVGMQQAAMPLFGMMVAPILVTQLLGLISWRYVFFIVLVPGLLVAYGLARTIRAPSSATASRHTTATMPADGHDSIWRHRNIILNIFSIFCWMMSLNVLTAMMPNYLVDHLHFGIKQMGFELSAMGLGCSLGTFLLLLLSDFIGRKTVLLISVAGAALSVFLLSQAHDPSMVYLGLLASCFFNFGALTLTTGPLSAESVPPGLMASASGMVVGLGEIFGGGAAPILVGFAVSHWGIAHIFALAMAALVLGFFIAMLLTETRPKQRRRTMGDALVARPENSLPESLQ